MPECAGCESFVTRDYVRVFKPEHADQVRVCPNCPDRIREGGGTRQARSPRRTDQTDDPVTYDPKVATDGGQP